MGIYVDAFLMPVSKKNLPAYKKMAKLGCKVWLEHGALSYVEAVGDDLAVQFGLPFTKIVKLKPSEVLIISFITYKSKADRKRITKLVMSDKRFEKMPEPMPFDMTKMGFGGFKSLVNG